MFRLDLNKKITRKTGDDGRKDVKIITPLKYFNNFLENSCNASNYCEINLILTWSTTCAISNSATNQAITFAITSRKLYVPVVLYQLMIQQLKSGFKRTTNWNKYQSKVTIQVQNRYLDYLIDTSFQGVYHS